MHALSATAKPYMQPTTKTPLSQKHIISRNGFLANLPLMQQHPECASATAGQRLPRGSAADRMSG